MKFNENEKKKITFSFLFFHDWNTGQLFSRFVFFTLKLKAVKMTKYNTIALYIATVLYITDR